MATALDRSRVFERGGHLRRLRQLTSDGAILVTAAVVSAFFVLPFLWIVKGSFTGEAALFSGGGGHYTLANFEKIFSQGFGRFIFNSLAICLVATLVSTFVSVMAAYTFSRRKFRTKKFFFGAILSVQIFPWVILVTPIFILFAKLGLLNSYGGIVFVYVAVTLPFSIYLLVGYLESVPHEIDEAAVMDGCPSFVLIWTIIFPIILPGVVATATYSFLLMWQEFLFALALLTKNELKTLPLGISQFFGEDQVSWGAVLAASVVTTVPALLLFIPLQSRLAKGLVAGAVKG